MNELEKENDHIEFLRLVFLLNLIVFEQIFYLENKYYDEKLQKTKEMVDKTNER